DTPYAAGTGRTLAALPPFPPPIRCPVAVLPVPEKTADGMTMLMSPETRFPERPTIPAGLLAMTLGSSVDAAAPAKALPSAAALFSRSWNPDPQLPPATASPIPATATTAASRLTELLTAPSLNHVFPRMAPV